MERAGGLGKKVSPEEVPESGGAGTGAAENETLKIRERKRDWQIGHEDGS
jgi:hypothetical protein